MFFSLLLLLLLAVFDSVHDVAAAPLPTPQQISCVSLLCLCAWLGVLFFLSIHNPWILCCVVGFSHHRSALVCCVWFPADHWRRRRAAAHNQKRARESLHWFEVMTKLMDSWNHDVKKQLVNGIYASSLSLSVSCSFSHFLSSISSSLVWDARFTHTRLGGGWTVGGSHRFICAMDTTYLFLYQYKKKEEKNWLIDRPSSESLDRLPISLRRRVYSRQMR